MSDSIINTTTATEPFTALDAEVLTGKGPSSQDIYRERVQVTGAQLAEIARVLKVPPDAFMYGLVVRPVGHVDDSDALNRIAASLVRIEQYLAAMSDEYLDDDNDSVSNDG